MKSRLAQLLSGKRARLLLLGGVLLLVAGGVAITKLAPRSAPVFQAATQTLSDSFYEDGMVRAQSRSVVSADISGKVLAVSAREGQSVRAGDPLLELDASDLRGERELLLAEKNTAMVAWEQSRELTQQQIVALEAQRAGYHAADLQDIYASQIAVLEASLDPHAPNSAAWFYEQMIGLSYEKAQTAGSSTWHAANATQQSQLEAAKVQAATFTTQKEQYAQQLAAQLLELEAQIAATADPTLKQQYQDLADSLQPANNAVLASYDSMLTEANAQINRLTNADSSYGLREAQQGALSEQVTLKEQYSHVGSNTQTQILALAAQQEQAAAAYRGASGTRKKLGEQIGLLEDTLEGDSGTAQYYLSQIERIDKAIAELDRKIALAQVLAPIDGVVGSLPAQQGAYLAAGSAITEVVDSSALQVECMLLTEDAASLQPGMRATLIWELRDGDRTFEAEIKEISALAVESVSAIGLAEQRVKVLLAPMFPTGESYPGDGYQLRVRFTTGQAEQVTVPRSAIVETDGGDAVFVVRDGRATLVYIQRGMESGADVGIASGLAPGDVVIEAPEGIREGDAISH